MKLIYGRPRLRRSAALQASTDIVATTDWTIAGRSLEGARSLGAVKRCWCTAGHGSAGTEPREEKRQKSEVCPKPQTPNPKPALLATGIPPCRCPLALLGNKHSRAHKRDQIIFNGLFHLFLKALFIVRFAREQVLSA
jgi:hypothetical protein